MTKMTKMVKPKSETKVYSTDKSTGKSKNYSDKEKAELSKK